MTSNLRLILVPVLITAISVTASSPKKAIASSMIGNTIHRKVVACPAQVAVGRARNALEQNILGAAEKAAGIPSVDTILGSVENSLFWSDAKGRKVFLTEGGQLVGSHDSLLAFRRNHKDAYSKWDSHHIVEEVHLRNLGRRYSSRGALPAVLIPKAAHSKRINSILRRADCLSLSARSLYSNYYVEAYELLGAYTGTATEAKIQAELLAIVRTLLGL